MARNFCGQCNGEGITWENIPDVGPPYLWSERKSVCSRCHGEGDLEMTPWEYDGLAVRVKQTGLVGVCSVFADTTAVVLTDDDREIAVGDYEELELLDA